MRKLPVPDDAIAVIGLGCWYPDAPRPSRLWENVLGRRQAFRRLPRARLPLESYYDPEARAPDKTYGRNAAVIDGFEFDWIGRRIPRRTFEGTDIAHWLALEVALQALSDAGYGRETLPRDRTGVVVGNTLTGEQSRSSSLRVRWPFIERTIRAAARHEGLAANATDDLVSSTQSYFKSVFPPVDEDTLAGALSNTIAGRICNFLDLRGGGYVVDGACASSLLAVTTAASALRDEDLDVALVGGVDISLDPFELVGFAKVGALSPTEMRVYDRAANGFVPGEGCGFVVLKRLFDARADGDYVYAVVRGWGVSSDGKGGITAPSVDGQALAIRRAYKRAGYSPELLHFVEGHGTGTPAGDPVELKAIAQAMKAYGAERPRSCGITSFKSIVGHTKAAAGIGGFIKAVIAANRRVVPPTSGCIDPNPTFDDEARVLYPLLEGHVESPDAVIRAGVSAMGFGGINTHVTLESGDPPASRLTPSVDEEALLSSAQGSELFVMAADGMDALKTRVGDVIRRSEGLSMGELADLAAELSAEAKFDVSARAAVVARNPDELEQRLAEVLDALRREPPARGVTRCCPEGNARAWVANGAPRANVGFLFPGQGSQQLGMARQLVRRFDWAKRFVERADEWLAELGEPAITPLIFRPLERALDHEQVLGWRRLLRQTQHAQPAICLASVLWLKHLARLGVSPAVVGGHSLGELSAFHAAGAFDERSLIQLAARRGRLMADADAPGAMANLSCGRQEAEELIEEASGYCAIANLNAPSQTVVSGDRDAVERLVRAAKARSIVAVLLDVSGAFHSAHFRAASTSLREADDFPDVSDPLHTPMLSAIDGAEIRAGVSIRDYLSRQMCAEVDFVTLAREMSSRCSLVLEVGPGRVLSGLVKRIVSEERLRCFPIESRPAEDQDLNVAVAALFAHGHRLRLETLYENRLCRPFVPASERKFIENPCERPFADEIAPSVTAIPFEPTRPALRLYPSPSGAPNASQESPNQQVRESQVVPKSATRCAVLAAVGEQTGFPVESLTLELRLVDDLHLDSIKTVELVSDVADQLGITETFDAAQFADATLGELVERLEQLEASPGSVVVADSKSDGAVAKDGRKTKPWVGNFALQWDEEPLRAGGEGRGVQAGRTLLLARDPHDALVLDVSRELVARGVDVHVSDARAASSDNTPFDHVLILSTRTAALRDVDSLHEVVELLTSGARALPSRKDVREQVGSVAWLRVYSSEPAGEGRYEWSPDAFAATVHLERPRLRVRSIEVEHAEALPARIADAVIGELADERAFASVRYDAEGRRLVAKPRLQSRASYRPRRTAIGADDVVLVTGGAKGITAECALALARETRALMVLVGSSPVPDQESRAGDGEEIRETLARFQAEGLRCDYRQCDLSERREVARLITGIRRDFGALDVVVHGAGLNHPRRVEEPDVSEVLREISPKVTGAMHLFDALDDAPPKMFVALTSVIGVIGMPHNAWYAFANQSLDRSLGRFAARHPSLEALSLGYSIWDEVGMGAKLGSIERLAKLGIEAIPVAEGAARFVELVTRDPGVREVIVTARLGSVDTWQPVLPPLPRAHRFIDKILALEPDRELICRTKLDLERDPYIRDHVYEGSHLLPAVFGLEAMAQAVAHVIGRSVLPFPLRIEDVELARPLLVHPDRGLVIEVQARVEEAASDGQRVRAEIRSEQTGFGQAHFSACFVVGGVTAPSSRTAEALGEALPIRPRRHLYGSVLFQGKSFQRIEEVYELDAKHCRFAATQGFSGETWLLGDPYFRDALLQSLQLCVVPDQCLPVRIDHWRIEECSPAPMVSRICKATIDGKEGDTYVGTVASVSSDGLPIESLGGYRARVLSRRPEWPSAEQLAMRSSEPVTSVGKIAAPRDARTQVNRPQPWDGGVFYRDVPGYGLEGQTAFFCRFPLSAQDSSSPSGSLNFTSYFRWAGKLREWGGMNTPGVYQGILEMLGSNQVMSATNECETRIFKVPQRNDLIEGRYWMEYVNKGDAGNIFEWWRIPFPTGEPEMVAWTRMRISAVKAIQHGVIASTHWPEFLYRFLKDMGDDATEPTKGPEPDLDLGEPLFIKAPGPQPGAWLTEETFATSQEDSNVVGNIYFANYSVWQGRVTDHFFHSLAPHLFENRGAHGELHRATTRISQLRDAMPFDAVRVLMSLEELYQRGARLSFEFFRAEPGGATKIAAGQSLVTWAKVERGSKPSVIDWPDEVREAMLALADGTAFGYRKPA